MTRMHRLAVAVLLVSGCTKKNPSFCDTDGDCANGLRCETGGHVCVPDVDASVVTPDAANCFGTSAFAVCVDSVTTEAVTLPNTLDTDLYSNCSAGQLWVDATQPPACFVVARRITVPNTVVSGTRTLVLVATDAVEVIGYLDASCHSVPTALAGPGAPGTPCGSFPTSLATSLNGAGGGAGAGFSSVGGQGGQGNNGQNAGGQPYSPIGMPTTLRGGCVGQSGGEGYAASNSGNAGGAIYLIGGSKITMASTALVNVSGCGAPASAKAGGGGGGGAGGMIVLNSPDFSMTTGATLVANGGGGASGGGASAGGGAGKDPDPTMAVTVAPGGTSGGGAGGAGCAGQVLADNGRAGVTGTGGGGGGGGCGFIAANKTLSDITASPGVTVQ